jgi:CRISPR-associated endonuclease Csn1
MRVQKGDYMKLLAAGNREQVMRVVRLRVKKQQLMLAEHKEAGNLDDRHKEEGDSFRWTFASLGTLKDWKARKVSVDALGRVRDPGPPS